MADDKVSLTIPEAEAEALLIEVESLGRDDMPMLVRLAGNLRVSLGCIDYEKKGIDCLVVREIQHEPCPYCGAIENRGCLRGARHGRL